MKATWMTVAAVALIAAAGPARSAEPAKADDKATLKPQTTCPVMGGKIDPAQFVDVEGHRIFICCAGCAGAIRKEPRKFIDKMTADGVRVATVQVDCPVTGKPVNRDTFADVDGKRVYVCCAGCVAKVKAEPGTWIKKLESAGVALDATPEAAK